VRMSSGEIAAIEPRPSIKVSKMQPVHGMMSRRTCGLQDTEEHEDELNSVLENGHQHGADDSSSSNAEADWQQVNSGLPERSTVNGIDLDRPEDDDGNVVDTRCKTENADSDKESFVLCQAHGKHGMFRTNLLPHSKCNQGDKTDCEGRDDVGGMPRVVLTSPVQTDQEDGDPANTQEGSDKVHALEALFLGQTNGVGSWWRLVPDGQENQRNQSQDPDDQSNPTPTMRGEKLAVEGRRRKRQETHHNVANGDSTFVRRHQLGDGGDGRQELDPDGDTRDGHGSDGSRNVLRGPQEDHGHDADEQADERGVFAPNQINQGTHERHDGPNGDELGDDEPDGLVSGAEIVCDDGEEGDQEEGDDFGDDKGQTEAHHGHEETKGDLLNRQHENDAFLPASFESIPCSQSQAHAWDTWRKKCGCPRNDN
jgi:hypothetical protein